MEVLYQFLEQKLPKNPKYSKEYLDLKAQEQNLVKQQRYQDAILVRKKCEVLEKEINEKFNKEKTEKIKYQSIKTANKHLNEKNAMKKKYEIEFEVMKKERQRNLDV